MRFHSAIVCALVGGAFSISAALGMTEALCGTMGCALFKTVSIAGINLYWYGAAGFAVLAGLLHAGRRNPGMRRLFNYCLAAGLLLDAVLLAILALTAPCLNCIVVAALFGLTAWAAWERGSPWRKVLGGWLLFFTAAFAGLGREAVSPQLLVRVPAEEGPALSLYFSPTCPGCKVAMAALLENPEALSHTALYAIAKHEEDTARVQRFINARAQGAPLPDALVDLVGDANATGTPLSTSQRLTIWSMSLRNKLAVLKAGSQTVPFLQSTTPAALLRLPASAQEQARETSQATGHNASPALGSPFQRSGNLCGFDDAAPCE